MITNGLRAWTAHAGLARGRGRVLFVLAFPLVVLIVGTPVALVVRLVIEISRRWW